MSTCELIHDVAADVYKKTEYLKELLKIWLVSCCENIYVSEKDTLKTNYG